MVGDEVVGDEVVGDDEVGDDEVDGDKEIIENTTEKNDTGEEEIIENIDIDIPNVEFLESVVKEKDLIPYVLLGKNSNYEQIKRIFSILGVQ